MGGAAGVTFAESMPKNNSDKEYIEELARCFTNSDRELTDEELLVLLLSFSDCKTHVRETVQEIKKHFGSFRNCYFASNSELSHIDGMTRNAAVLMQLTAAIANHRDIPSLLGKYVHDYCDLFASVIGKSLDEELWAAALTDKGELINVECISRGTVNMVGVSGSVLCRFAAKNKSRYVVVAHSHLDGCSPEASKMDFKAMEYVGSTMSLYGITLIGQVILSDKGARFYPYENNKDDI